MSIVERALKKAQAQPQKAPAEAVVESPSARSDPDAPPDNFHAGSAQPLADSPPAARQILRSIVLEISKLRAEGMLPDGDDELRLTDEFRRLKWPVLGAALGRGAPRTADNNLVLVTSSIPAEGKTFTSFNLALAIAREKDTPVVLVDGDSPNPRLSSLLGLADRPGLVDVVGDAGASINDVLYATDEGGLFIVPAGRRDSNSPELFASNRMQEVVKAIADLVPDGIVIIDSPPVLATNEAQVLSRYVGQVLMVVRANFTEQRAVEEALALLDRTKPVNCMLNAVDRDALSMYYGDSYSGYGGYGKSADRYGRGSRADG